MITYVSIEKLTADPRFQKLKFRQEETNIFTVVGQTHTEHWHSSFISWLLDPHSSLRLGHFPLIRLLTMYMIKNPDCGFTLKDIYDWDLDSIRFSTEKDATFQGGKRSIDVYGESRELILVIENKVNASENYNNSSQGQTMDYFSYVEANKSPEQRALYFFIAADQNQRAFADMYVHISYQEMYDNIISKCIEHPQVSDNGKYLLKQYAANLRETIHNSNTPMALVNIDLCKDLYDDHAELLDEIFHLVKETGTSESTDPGWFIYDHYQSVFDEIYLSVEKYGETPRSNIRRRQISIDDLYKKRMFNDSMNFTMKYNGEIYYAKTVLAKDKKWYLQVLDENRKAIIRDGKIVGVYANPSLAALEVINLRGEENGKAPVNTIKGDVYWVNEEGLSIKELLDKR